MSTENTEKPEMSVVAIKTKMGDDILAYYVGDMDMAFSDEKAIVLLRPVRIETLYRPTPSGLKTYYVPSLYFPFSDNAFPFALSSISHQGMANSFFVKLYKNVLIELIVSEENRQEEISNAIDLKEVEDMICKTSTLVYSDTKYAQ